MATGTWETNKVLLWTNPSPTSSFGAQTVPLDLSEYNMVLVISKNSTDPADTMSFYSFCKVGLTTRTDIPIFFNNSFLVRTRTITVKSNGIEFSNATQNGTSIVSLMPWYIYGIRA